MSSEISEGQEFLFVKPERPNGWSYQIDNGKIHSIREWNLYPYVKGFLKGSKECAVTVDIISRHQPFIVNLKEGSVKELHPSMETESYHREKIAEDLSKAMRGLENEGTILGDNLKTLRFSSRREDQYDSLFRNSIRAIQRKELYNPFEKRRKI